LSRDRYERRARVWVLAAVALCMVGAMPAQAQGQSPAGSRGGQLVLKLGGGQERWLLDRKGGRPYPEFLLQRWEGGAWKVYAAEEFRRGQGQVVIPGLQPGTYRVVAAASPYELYESESVELGASNKPAMTTLRAITPGVPCEIIMISSRTRQPVAGLSFAVSGPYASLPPSRGVTDAKGSLRLGTVRSSELHLELEHGGDEPLTWERARQCLESGRVEIIVPM